MSTEYVSKDKSAKQFRILRDAEVIVTDEYTTTNSFADLVGAIIDAPNYESLAIIFKNTGGTNGASWEILGSIDGTTMWKWSFCERSSRCNWNSLHSFKSTVSLLQG